MVLIILVILNIFSSSSCSFLVFLLPRFPYIIPCGVLHMYFIFFVVFFVVCFIFRVCFVIFILALSYFLFNKNHCVFSQIYVFRIYFLTTSIFFYRNLMFGYGRNWKLGIFQYISTCVIIKHILSFLLFDCVVTLFTHWPQHYLFWLVSCYSC